LFFNTFIHPANSAFLFTFTALITIRFMQKTLFLFLFILLSVCSYGQPVRKVLFIGVDGCRADALLAANTPAIDSLLSHAVYSTDGLCAYKTWSGNGWSSMLTGTWHTKHGVTDNTFAGSNYSTYPDFISRLETFNPALRTVTSVHWAPLNDTIIQNADSEGTYTTDLAVKVGATDALTNDNPDLLFVAFDDVDHAGHSFGFSPAIQQYIQAIETTDGYIGEIITAMQNRPNFANEDWLVVVTTDHGGTLLGHGGGDLTERTIFTIYSNPAFAPQQLSRNIINQTDTFNEAHFIPQTFAQPINQTPFLFGTAQDFTIEFWIKPSPFTDDPAFISNKNWNSGVNPGFVISAQQGYYWKVNIGDGTDRLDIQGGNLVPNQWHHLAVSFDRTGLMTAYEDGVVVGFEKMQNIDNINTGLPLVINQDGTTTYGFNMEAGYKDIRIWNAVIPDSTIVQWATVAVNPQHPFYNQLLANWQCEDGTGSVLQDASPNNNDCNITGALTWNNNQSATFTAYDYLQTTREPDNAVTALTWLCVPIQPNWNLDGNSHVAPCSVVSISDVENETGITVFPNPAKDMLSVVFANPSVKSANALIYDYSGRLIKEFLIAANKTNASINIKGLTKGIYFLKLNNSNAPATHKFIIE
jgi:Type I phosphodiesterase / nucleotide pyrophosphatase/Concanavalin A-like lectin/glucanases superfamily/Secretion system C-terminal sorting domain/Domain of unknown function (DUF4983)